LEVEGAEEHYSEKLVRLKSHQLTFYYKPTLPFFSKCRRDFGLEDQDHLYLCPQALFKFHPDFDFVLAKILEYDQKGQIILPEGTHPNWTERLKNRFRQTIPATVIERILFIKRMTLGDYFNLIVLSDVMLDPFPFGGGNTSYEALAVGIPIVTLPTKFMRGRLTYACYRQMGMMDCVAENPPNYVEIALRLGTELSFREQIKAKILATHDLLYEDMNVVREFEKCFWEWVIGN
jgi:predicted O-linked N-acetylglucosamine transferase (SPINDLY family)